MKKTFYFPMVAVLAAFMMLSSCNNISLTSWKNPKESLQVSRIVVWGMFNKLEYEKPLEQSMTGYFNSKGLKSTEALQILSPDKKYELADLERKLDSAGADGLLLITYKGTDKQENYVPPTTTVYPDFYYNYYSYYNWGYPYYGAGYSTVTTGGYWTTTSIINLQANLYANSNNSLLWTGSIQITDPQYIDEVSYNLAKTIYADLLKNGLIKQ